MPQRTAIGNEFRQSLVEFADRIGGIDAEGPQKTVRSVAITVPYFALLVLLATEEDALRPVAPNTTSTASGSESR